MEEHAYFRAIEERFITLRGAPLLLSPADYQVAREWWRNGVPLNIVEEALEELFSRQPERKIQSLRYCASAVEAAWKRAETLEQAGRRTPQPPMDLTGRLQRLAEALPTDLAGGDAIRRELLTQEGAPEEIEAQLAELDARLIALAEATLSADEREALEQRLLGALEPLAERLPESEVAAARRRLFEQALRRERKLPFLSLFSG